MYWYELRAIMCVSSGRSVKAVEWGILPSPSQTRSELALTKLPWAFHLYCCHHNLVLPTPGTSVFQVCLENRVTRSRHPWLVAERLFPPVSKKLDKDLVSTLLLGWFPNLACPLLSLSDLLAALMICVKLVLKLISKPWLLAFLLTLSVVESLVRLCFLQDLWMRACRGVSCLRYLRVVQICHVHFWSVAREADHCLKAPGCRSLAPFQEHTQWLQLWLVATTNRHHDNILFKVISM